jgi:hypothetical protein
MIVLQSPIVSPGVLERELVYLSPRVAGAIESGGQTACELRTNSLSPRGTNGERAGERGGLRIAPPLPGALLLETPPGLKLPFPWGTSILGVFQKPD